MDKDVYAAERAAALSGVPKSTIHWWARNQILVPIVSSGRVRLWSYADLMGLRVGTRNETCALAALAKDGFSTERILSLYPYLTPEQIEQAIDLERQLDENLLLKVAAA